MFILFCAEDVRTEVEVGDRGRGGVTEAFGAGGARPREPSLSGGLKWFSRTFPLLVETGSRRGQDRGATEGSAEARRRGETPVPRRRLGGPRRSN